MRLQRKIHIRRNLDKGDTIVEVLIAIAIVSTVLAAAFTVTQKSVLAVRDSQERGEVLQLLQGQVELVRAMAATEATDTTGVFDTTPPKYICVTTSGAGVHSVQSPSGSFALPANLQTDPLNNYAPCQFGSNNLYKIVAKYNPATKIFVFTARWDRVGGSKDQMQLSYRVYPGGP